MIAKDKAKLKSCERCRLFKSPYCRECYDFGLWAPKIKELEAYF